MVVWPDRPADCPVPARPDDGADRGRCAHILFSDGTGNSGTLSIAVKAGAAAGVGGVWFGGATYGSDDRGRAIGSLNELHDRLSERAGR
jgi:hypothetical protein